MKLRLLLLSILCLYCFAGTQAQKDTRARQLLDRTAAIFTGSGVQIDFSIQNMPNTTPVNGTILIKGDKFRLETPSSITWFDGKTQWSYLVDNQEVNISNPTPEELQSINPYAFIGLYKQGYQYSIGSLKQYKGKSVTEINLQAENPQQDIQHATLYVSDNNGQPFFIKITDCNKNITSIEVLSLKKGLNLPENQFTFDKKKYSQAEIIDLR